MLSTTTTAIVSHISEAVAIDNETSIMPVRTLPLVTLTCHEIITAQDASLRASAADVYVKSLVIAELDGVVAALEENLEELKGDYADVVSMGRQNVASLQARLSAHERDMAGTLKALEDARKASVILLEMADTASKDCDRAVATNRSFRDMLEASGKREDEQYETLMGVRALAQSDMLTDAEKVALILRMVK